MYTKILNLIKVKRFHYKYKYFGATKTRGTFLINSKEGGFMFNNIGYINKGVVSTLSKDIINDGTCITMFLAEEY